MNEKLIIIEFRWHHIKCVMKSIIHNRVNGEAYVNKIDGIEQLSTNENIRIKIVDKPDIMCKNCLFFSSNRCISEEKVAALDEIVKSEVRKISNSQDYVFSFQEFCELAEKVSDRVCGACAWGKADKCPAIRGYNK